MNAHVGRPRPCSRLRAVAPAAVAMALFVPGCAGWRGPERAVGGDPTLPAELTLKVVFDRHPVEGAFVRFHDDEGGAPAAATRLEVGPSDERGEVRARLPAGRYYVVAEQHAEDGTLQRHAWFGGNPLVLGGDDRAYVVLNTVDVTRAVSLEVLRDVQLPGSGVMGVVADTDGHPVSGAYVYAYLSAKKGFRDRPYELSARTSDAGFFNLALPPGPYHLIARWRRSGGFAGPMGIGDRFGYDPSNPVEVPDDGYRHIAIRIAEILDPNVVARAAADEASGGKAPADPIDPAARFIGPKSTFARTASGDGVIRGRITDGDDRPVAGFHATLYRNPDFLWQPDVMSAVTHADGRYELVVSEPGEYHVGARNYYGRQLEFGDFYGFYDGEAGARVRVEAGDVVEGVDIHVQEYRFD